MFSLEFCCTNTACNLKNGVFNKNKWKCIIVEVDCSQKDNSKELASTKNKAEISDLFNEPKAAPPLAAHKLLLQFTQILVIH